MCVAIVPIEEASLGEVSLSEVYIVQAPPVGRFAAGVPISGVVSRVRSVAVVTAGVDIADILIKGASGVVTSASDVLIPIRFVVVAPAGEDIASVLIVGVSGVVTSISSALVPALLTAGVATAFVAAIGAVDGVGTDLRSSCNMPCMHELSIETPVLSMGEALLRVLRVVSAALTLRFLR